MRILFVTAHKYLPEIRGGMEISTHALCLAARKRGVDATVLCGLAGFGLVGASARFKRKVLRNECPMDRTVGYQVWRSYSPESHVAAVAKRFRPSAIILQGEFCFAPLVSTCLQLEYPLFGYLHSQDRLHLEGPLESARSKMVFFANSLFTMSLHPEKKFAGILAPLMRAEDYRTTTARTHAVLVNPVPIKGLDVVLRLAESRPDVKFLLVWNPHSRSAHPEIGRWRTLANVSLCGPFHDMRKVYRMAKVILAPSQVRETFGRVVAEGHFSGIPALASQQGGLPETVGPGGICVAADAPIADWLQAFAATWDDEGYYGILSREAERHSARPEIQPEFVIDRFLGTLSRPAEA